MINALKTTQRDPQFEGCILMGHSVQGGEASDISTCYVPSFRNWLQSRTVSFNGKELPMQPKLPFSKTMIDHFPLEIEKVFRFQSAVYKKFRKRNIN